MAGLLEAVTNSNTRPFGDNVQMKRKHQWKALYHLPSDSYLLNLNDTQVRDLFMLVTL